MSKTAHNKGESQSFLERIRQDRAFLQSVFNRIPGMIYVHDLEHDVNLYRSLTLKKILGVDDSEHLNSGKHIRSLIHPDDIDAFKKAGQHLLTVADNECVRCTFRMRHASGKWLWFRSEEYVFERNARGKPIKTLGYTTDMTHPIEQQKELDRLNEVNQFLLKAAQILSQPYKDYKTTLQELAQNISLYLNVVCDVSILNEQTGIIKPEAQYHPDKEIRQHISQILSQKEVRKGEGLVGITIATGKEVVINGVSESVKARAREVSEKVVPHAIVYVPLQGSQAVFGTLNLTRLEGQAAFTDVELNQARRLGEYVSLFVENALLKSKQNREIEERKKIERKLAQSTKIVAQREADTRNILNAIPIFIARVSSELKYLFVNDAYKRWEPNLREMEGKDVRKTNKLDAAVTHDNRLEEVLSGQLVNYEFEGVMPDGIYRYFNVALAPDYSEKGEVVGYFSCATDMTSKVLAERSVRLTQDRLESLTLNSGDAFFFYDIEQNILDVNQVATEILGYSREEFLAMKASQIDPVWKGNTYQRFIKNLEVNTPQTFDTTVYKKDGTEMPVEVRLVKRMEDNKVYLQSLLRDRTEKRDRELRLQQSEERLRLIFDNVEDHIAILNKDGVFESINKTTQGLKEEDVVGHTIYEFVEDPTHLRRKFERLKQGGGDFQDTSSYTGLDGSRVLYSRKYIGIFYAKKFYRAIMIVRDITAERDREQTEMSAVLRGQELERKRLGAELHDGIGQVLSAIALQVSQIREDIRKNQRSKVVGDLSNLNLNLQQAIREVRNISHDLMPEVLEGFGLKEAINQTCNNVQDRSGITVIFNHADLESRYDSLLEVNLFRITQELLSNIQKHASCTNVFVSLMDHGQSLNLTVEDDGVGFNTEESSAGIGLSNVISRVNSINGEIEIESSPQSGTLVNIEIPKER